VDHDNYPHTPPPIKLSTFFSPLSLSICLPIKLSADSRSADDPLVGCGCLLIAIGRCDVFKEVPFSSPVRVATLGAGHSFGELALMYSAPRAATVTAKINTVTWTIKGSVFRRVMQDGAIAKRKEYGEFVDTIPLFAALDEHDKGLVADAFQEVHLEDEQVAVKKGETGTHLFIVQDGQMQTEAVGDEEEEEYYDPGDFFGEKESD
jgi:CRP-like cAMP-binding protein